MRHRLPYRIALTRLVTIICLLFITLSTNAQISKFVYKTQILADTLVAANNKDFLYNNITITNLSTDKITVLVNISVPEGWQIITQKLITLSLNANENTNIPVRIAPRNTKTAAWHTIRIEYRLNSSIETLVDSFRVRVQEFTKFKALLPNSNYVLTTYQRTLNFPLYIKNMGNVPKDYELSFKNSMLQLDYKMKLRMEAGEDTLYQLPIRLSESQWALLRKETIKVEVDGGKGETVNLEQTISKVGSMLKENPSAYLDMPLQVETGFSYQETSGIQYYGGLHGSLDLTNEDRIVFDLRSNTYSTGQVVNNHIARAEYTGKKCYGTVGNFTELTDFLLDGYGGKVGRNIGLKSKAEVYGIAKSRNGNSKLAGGNVILDLNESVRLTESATANFDTTLNSYVFKQGATYKWNGDMGKLSLTAGAGIDQPLTNIANTNSQYLLGSTLGYSLMWSEKYMSINSSALYNSNSFPGFLKGQRQQIHDVRGIYKSAFLGGYYEYSFRKQNYYTDTALFSDVFNLQTSNYGARAGWGYKGSNLTLSAGKQSQVQIDSNNKVYIFSYLNPNVSILLFKRLFVSVNSYIGQGTLEGYEKDSAVGVTSTQVNMQYKFAGVTGRLDRGPYYYNEYITYLKNPQQQYSNLIFSPFLDLKLMKSTLNIRTQFNYARSMPDNVENSTALANISYSNLQRGFDINLNGIVPVNQVNTGIYVNMSMRMRLHAPFVAIRKYYNLRLFLFKDTNGNGKFDAGEEPVKEQTLSLKHEKTQGDVIFVTNDQGEAVYKNISEGNVKVNFGMNSRMRGWIPSNGIIQQFAQKGNKTIYVPYKMSKVLEGKLRVTIDSMSNNKFNPANIRVEAISEDSTGTVYSTLTEENGEFYFNLPAGYYTIKLGEAAFDENFQPAEWSQRADMLNNDTKAIYFDIKQKKRAINIRRK